MLSFGGMGWLQLTKSHKDLLNEMYSVALKVIAMQGKQPKDFLIGYHAETSIKHLLLNVISIDFNASGLRTQSQWNSFNTQLFIPHDGERTMNFHPLKRQKINCSLFYCSAAATYPEAWKHFEIRSDFGGDPFRYTIEMSSMRCQTMQYACTQITFTCAFKLTRAHSNLKLLSFFHDFSTQCHLFKISSSLSIKIKHFCYSNYIKKQ